LYSVSFTDANNGTAVGVGTILRTINGGVKVINISTEIPSKYLLKQNYPNPFNPSTKIRFDIPKSSYIKLMVYDILGREIKTLVNENLNAGRYVIKWDGSNYSSGVYFYRFVTGDFVDVKKMLLVK